MMRLHRNRWLIFPAPRETIQIVSSLAYLAGVNVVIWVGLFFYLWRLDRRISGKEREP
jgi:CcmD family protein